MLLNTPQSQAAWSSQNKTKAPEIGDTFQDYVWFLQEGMATQREKIVITKDISLETLQTYTNNPNAILVMTNASQEQKDSLTHVAGAIVDQSKTTKDHQYANLEYVWWTLIFSDAQSVLLPKLKICGGNITTTTATWPVIAPVLEFVRGRFEASNNEQEELSYPKLKGAWEIVGKAKRIGLPSLIVVWTLFLRCEHLDIRSLAQTWLWSNDQEHKAQEKRSEKRSDTRWLRFNAYQGTITINGPRYIDALNLQVSYSKILLRDVYQANFNRLWRLTSIRDDTYTENESATKLTVIWLPSLERISDFAHLPNVAHLDLPKLNHGGRIIYAPKAKYFEAPALETMSGAGHIESSMQYPAYLILEQCERFSTPKLQTSTFSTAEIKLPSSCIMNINPALFELQKMHLKPTDPGGRLSTIEIVWEHNKQPKTNPTWLPTAQHYYNIQQKLIPTLPKPKEK